MLNKYPLWKNILILVVLAIGFIYASPNLFPDDYAIQITGARSGAEISEQTVNRAVAAVTEAGIPVKGVDRDDRTALIRVETSDGQLRARPIVQQALGDDFLVALNMAESTPGWLKAVGAGPMKLGLDLRGGVHFLLEVDMDTAIEQRLEATSSQIKRELREERIRYRGGDVSRGNSIELSFRSNADRSEALRTIRERYSEYVVEESTEGDNFLLNMRMSEQEVRNIHDYAIQQNLTTIRNRVNELGVAEPLVQRQGANRIIVELPGVQDTAQAKRVLGATANLEFRLAARQDVPVATTESYGFRDNPDRTARLERDVIVTGENVANASQSFDENGMPQVNITLNGVGGDLMTRATRNAIGRSMAVLFIEFRTEMTQEVVDGEIVTREDRVQETSIISLATIQSTLGASFRITGLDSVHEAAELALLLRAGALAAPMYFVQERTIGPSLGQQNIEAGFKSVVVGFILVMIFMGVFYRAFGMIANIALALNVVLLLACMSIISATLTLPGIAGIVLTVGMAVDANVLIFERIREEMRGGATPQLAINAGFSRAFVSILDANITTFLVGVILFALGSGPVKGFAVTLTLGIATSLFSALMVSRMIINFIHGGRKLETLSIGGKLANV